MGLKNSQKILGERFYSYPCSLLPGFPPTLKKKITPYIGFKILSRNLKKMPLQNFTYIYTILIINITLTNIII